MNPKSSFSLFWQWLNSKPILPWVAIMLSAVAAFAHFEAESTAQEVRVTEFKQVATENITDLRRDLEQSQTQFQSMVLTSLNRIEAAQKENREELKSVKSDVVSISADLDRVCYRVNADCRR